MEKDALHLTTFDGMLVVSSFHSSAMGEQHRIEDKFKQWWVKDLNVLIKTLNEFLPCWIHAKGKLMSSPVIVAALSGMPDKQYEAKGQEPDQKGKNDNLPYALYFHTIVSNGTNIRLRRTAKPTETSSIHGSVNVVHSHFQGRSGIDVALNVVN